MHQTPYGSITEILVYGSSRLGSYTVTSGNYAYELRDNLDSVRVVINRNKNSSGRHTSSSIMITRIE